MRSKRFHSHFLLLPALVVVASGCAMYGYPAGAPSGSEPGPAAGSPATSGGRTGPSEYEVDGRRYFVMGSATGYRAVGLASWYGPGFDGRPTSSGEPFDRYAMTAAHRTLPLGTRVRVRNVRSGRAVVVRINDRGPFKDPDRRIIDLSFAAAREIGVVEPGTAEVEVQALDE